MRRTLRWAAALGGLLTLLLVPGVALAHDITQIQVDCEHETILVSGTSFDGDVTVTVSGPQGYVQTFIPEAGGVWTVSLPLGPSGRYSIEWPGSGGDSATFTVDCESESPPPGTASPPPATPKPAKTPDHHVPATPDHTLPPTDITTTSSVVARTDTVLATLLFIAIFALAVALRRTAQRSSRRR